MLGICKRKIEVIVKIFHFNSNFLHPNKTEQIPSSNTGGIRDRIDKESFYFHFIAWALPFVLTIAIMILSEVDGNSIFGICFVGYRNPTVKTALVVGPVGILSFGVSIFFTCKGCLNLNRIKRATTTHIDETKTLNAHIVGTGLRTVLIVSFIGAFIVLDQYDVHNSDLWKTSLNEFIM